MARDLDDVTDGATDGETRGTMQARRRALGDNPFTPEQMAEAIARAQQRVAEDVAKAKTAPLPEIVRASVRCGYENIKQGDKIVVRAGSITFTEAETADGSRVTVQHGRPVRLKREAFLRYSRDGKVEIAQ